MIYFFERVETEAAPAGVTVSKNPELPSGDFEVKEFIWGETSLWFVADDKFTADERQAAYRRMSQCMT